MRKFSKIIIVLGCFISAAVRASDDKLLALIKGAEIHESQIMAYFKSELDAKTEWKGKKFGELDSRVQNALVRQYITNKLLEEEGKVLGIESTPEFQSELKKIQQNLLLQKVIEYSLKGVVTDAKIDEKYDAIVKDLSSKEEVKVSHILVQSEPEAKRIREQVVTQKASFSDLAQKFSKDDRSKATGGTLGYFTQDSLVPEFAGAAFALKVGDISQPVKTVFGWHIIRVDDRRKAIIPPKAEMTPTIRNDITRESVDEYLGRLNAKAETKLLLDVVDPHKAESKKPESKDKDSKSESKVDSKAEKAEPKTEKTESKAEVEKDKPVTKKGEEHAKNTKSGDGAGKKNKE